MQGDAGTLNTSRFELSQNSFIKMQGRSRCRHRAGVLGKHGLIALFVVCGIIVGDVRRQWHVPKSGHQRIRIAAELEFIQRPVGVWPSAKQRCCKTSVHLQHSARQRFFTDFHVRCDFVTGFCVWRQHPLDQKFEPAAAGLVAEQSCFDDLGVVKHQ